jgi:hypothetical protein
MAYQYHNRKAKPIPATFDDSDAERFWTLVDKSVGQGPKGDCWQWKQACYLAGYGRFSIGPKDNHKNLRAHRVAYLVGYGENPGYQMVLHSCDNPACVRPDHLSLGDAKKNKQDQLERGRVAKGMNAGPATRSIFTPERIKAIRRAWDSGLISQAQLALIAGTKQKTMNDILRRKSWDYPECG